MEAKFPSTLQMEEASSPTDTIWSSKLNNELNAMIYKRLLSMCHLKS